MKLYLEIFVLLKLKLYKNKKYSKFIIRGRQRNPPEEGDIYLLQQSDDGHLFHQLQQTEVQKDLCLFKLVERKVHRPPAKEDIVSP